MSDKSPPRVYRTQEIRLPLSNRFETVAFVSLEHLEDFVQQCKAGGAKDIMVAWGQYHESDHLYALRWVTAIRDVPAGGPAPVGKGST